MRKAKSSIVFGAVDPVESLPPPLPTRPPPSSTTESEEAIKIDKNNLPACPCTEEHNSGKLLNNIVVGMPVDALYNLIFVSRTRMDEVHQRNKCYDIVYEEWKKNEETQESKRTIKYTMDIPPTGLGPKFSNITENQTLLSTSKPGDMYIVTAEATNQGIPYGDNFFIQTHYCLTRDTVTGDSTRYCAYGQIKYKKSTWGFIKGIIEKNAFNGMENIQDDLRETLINQSPVKQPQTMVKRRKKRTASVDLRNMKLQAQATESVPPLQKPVYSARCWGVLSLLVLLIGVNGFLLYKLRTLEARTRYDDVISLSDNERNILKNWVGSDRTWGDVARLLEKQEIIHSNQLQEWMHLLSNSAKSLSSAESSLEDVKKNLIDYKNKRTRRLIDNLVDRSNSPEKISSDMK